MTERLKTNLYAKHRLAFREDGRFKVLMLSDIQESADYNEKSLRAVEGMVAAERPDLVMLGGDNVYGPKVRTPEELTAMLDAFTEPMERRGIPWAHVFGNHDHDLPFGGDVQQAIYERYPHCVSKRTPSDIHGVTNFVLPVHRHDGDAVAFAVWGLDSNNTMDGLDSLVPGGDMAAEGRLDNRPVGGGLWDIPRFDQLMWYWNSSVELEEHCGGKVPGLLCMHIAPFEFLTAIHNPEACGLRGEADETPDPGVLNSGLFAEILQRGDIRCIGCGHTHKDTFDATYCGIRLCFDGCAGFTHYGIDERRGGRVFEIHEDDPWRIETRMLRALDVME